MASQVLIIVTPTAVSQVAPAVAALQSLAVACEVRIWGASEDDAGDAAHLAVADLAGLAAEIGVFVVATESVDLVRLVAAQTLRPVVHLPLASAPLTCVGPLREMAQTGDGAPFATVAVNGAHNAGLLAAQLLAASDGALLERIAADKGELAAAVREKDRTLRQLGVGEYVRQMQ